MALLKTFLFAYLLSQCLCYAFEERVITELQHLHKIQLSSLLPSSICNPSTKGNGSKSTLKLVHRHGPCYKPNGSKKAKTASHSEILLQDQSRVKAIHSRLSGRLHKVETTGIAASAASTTLPAKDGDLLGSANYFLNVGLGTPNKYLSLMFDTGSDLTWTQCKPCLGYCYPQKEPIFEPRISKSYRNISCSSTLCTSLESATGNTPNCASSTCVYGIQYGDSSFSVGFFAMETLTLTSTDIFPNFLFGCGQNNRGLFRGVAGILGLGRSQISLVQQTAAKYNKRFSYCLPSSPSSMGHLTFGRSAGISKPVIFTPLSSRFQRTPFYGLDMIGISVAGNRLPIATSVFSTPGTIIDSGTVITRLPPNAYTVLRRAFRQRMSEYPRAPTPPLFDTCYDFSQYDTITYPMISFFFSGGVELRVDKSGIMYAISESQVCLAFAGNSDPNDVGIFGNLQQLTFEVVHDVNGGKVGFAAGGCS